MVGRVRGGTSAEDDGDGRGADMAARGATGGARPATDHEVRQVLECGLFDAAWYSATAGCDPEPRAAARHYLEGGCEEGHTSHPLFDHRHLLARFADVVGERNPLLAYLEDPRLRRASTQPLMGYRRYQQAHREASRYSRGVTRHYLEVGAAKGYEPTTWYVPDPAAEPEGLADWLRARRAEWMERRALADGPWSTTPPTGSGGTGPSPAGTAARSDLVCVVVPAVEAWEGVRSAVTSVLGQSGVRVEVVLVHPPEVDGALHDLLGELDEDPRLRRHLVAARGTAALVAAGAAVAEGDWVAFCAPTVEWDEHHLATALARAEATGADVVAAVVERVDEEDVRWYRTGAPGTDRSLARQQLDPSAVVIRRDVLAELGGVDASVGCAWFHDLELSFSARGPVATVARVGVRTTWQREADEAAASMPPRERPALDLEELPTWHHVVVARRLVDWDTIGPGEAGVVSVVMPTHADFVMTRRAVLRLAEDREAVHARWEEAGSPPDGRPCELDVVVVDNGCPADLAAALDSLPLEFGFVRVLHLPVNHGFSLGNDIAVPHTRGATVVFLNNDTEVRPGWLEPLEAALEDPDVLGAQSLLVYPSGSIQSAGVAFPVGGGVPYALLQGHPVEDAEGLAGVPLRACTAAALAMRRADVAAVQGFDPLFLNGMEDVDLGLRMAELRPGRFTVRPDSVVVHHESKAPGRFAASVTNRRLYLERWAGRWPTDDLTLWRSVGFDVVGHRVAHLIGSDPRTSIPLPTVVRPRVSVDEGAPRLRWALKNPAPYGPEAERWGDTHFIRRLAAALRRLGQEVVIDHRPEFARVSGHLDDVVLVLRGLAPYRPRYGQVSMCWLISHPEMMSRREAHDYDRVFAASVPWSARTSEEWGVRIDPLLQATDPELFTPDRGRPDTGYPLLFLGSSRKVLRPLVGAALERRLGVSVIGNQWEGLIPPAVIKAEYADFDTVGELYRRAGIVLNDHWDDMRVEGFLSNRLFDAVASGARVVTDDVQGLAGVFGRSVQVARDADELEALVTTPDLDAVFGDDEERRTAAARVHRDHSFDARAATLLEAALTAGADRASVYRDRPHPATEGR